MKSEILKILKEAQDYVSGQSICEQLQVSRTAVWKAVNRLKEEGYDIVSVTNRGYLLKESPDVITREEILSKIKTGKIASQVVYFDETDSTNTQAKLAAEQGEKDGTLFVADVQTAGKGRRGRSWVSPQGTGIWMTLLLRPKCPPDCASQLTLVAAMAVSQAIRKVTGLEAKIKWPNDVVVHSKKVCGILTEMSAEEDYVNHVVIGIGINVNMCEFPPEIAETATSLKIELGKSVVRSTVIAEFAAAFEKYYAEYNKTYDLSRLCEEYNDNLVNAGRKVRVLGENEYNATAIGINDTGELIVIDEDGKRQYIRSGEVSVRGIYGYV